MGLRRYRGSWRPWPSGTSGLPRSIITHMIKEYARHNGHADLLRERIDGSTGYPGAARLSETRPSATPSRAVRAAAEHAARTMTRFRHRRPGSQFPVRWPDQERDSPEASAQHQNRQDDQAWPHANPQVAMNPCPAHAAPYQRKACWNRRRCQPWPGLPAQWPVARTYRRFSYPPGPCCAMDSSSADRACGASKDTVRRWRWSVAALPGSWRWPASSLRHSCGESPKPRTPAWPGPAPPAWQPGCRAPPIAGVHGPA
jgi:hypothetical protein